MDKLVKTNADTNTSMKNKQFVKKAVWQKECLVTKTKWQSEGEMTVQQLCC